MENFRAPIIRENKYAIRSNGHDVDDDDGTTAISREKQKSHKCVRDP